MNEGADCWAEALPFPTSADEEARILEALQGVDEWGWDVFKLKDASSNRELEVLGWHLLREWKVHQQLGLDPLTTRNWLVFVSNSYTDSEYHNVTHACDVLQTIHFMLGRGGAAAFLSELEIFALLLAAMFHDAGHDGYTNSFHKHAVTDRALAFNDQSIQENFHAWKMFSTMAIDRTINLFRSLSSTHFAEIRRLLMTMILSTDMSKHFGLLQDIKSLVEEKGCDLSKWSGSTDQLMCFLLHASDISAQSKPHHLAMIWYTPSHCLYHPRLFQGWSSAPMIARVRRAGTTLTRALPSPRLSGSRCPVLE